MYIRKKGGSPPETPYFFSFASFLDIQRRGSFSLELLTFITQVKSAQLVFDRCVLLFIILTHFFRVTKYGFNRASQVLSYLFHTAPRLKVDVQ